MPIAVSPAKMVLTRKEALADVDECSALRSRRSFSCDEEPSHDSPSSSRARGPTRSTNACCSVLPPRTWSVVPVATIVPWSMMDTWSQTCSTSSMTWLENSTVEPELVKRVSRRRITSAEIGSTPSSGSSRNSTDGLWISAQPSVAFLRMPVE